jgi:rare lipoprotein A (peptidoglycan hydrolase)
VQLPASSPRRWPSLVSAGYDESDMRILILIAAVLASPLLIPRARAARAELYGYAGYATYYGIEDGFVRGDVMFDGTPYDPADPSITAASFLIPLHTWLRVCSPSNCISVQVRDRGLLDENGILLDLSRAAYAQLFGGLGGKQWVSAYFASAPAASGAPDSGLPALPSQPAGPSQPATSAQPAAPTPSPTPQPGKMQWQAGG